MAHCDTKVLFYVRVPQVDKDTTITSEVSAKFDNASQKPESASVRVICEDEE